MNEDMLDVFNPYDLKFIESVPLSNWETVDEYLTVARRLFRDRKGWLSAYKRVEILKKLPKL